MPAKEALGTALYSSGYFEKALMMFHKINRYTVVQLVQYTVQYSTVQYSAVQYSTVQYSTVHYSAVQCSTS